MALFPWFPTTNFHEMNLDWIIKKIKEISEQIPEGLIGISKGGTGADNAADARTNLGIYAENIQTSPNDPTTIDTRLNTLLNNFLSFEGDVQYKIYRNVTKIGQVIGTATISGCWSALAIGEILLAPASQFTPSQVPEVSGAVMICKNASASGYIRFYGNKTYEMELVGNAPAGLWKALYSNTDVIPVSNGGTGANNPVDARANLGIDFTGEVLSVAGVGADSAGNVPGNDLRDALNMAYQMFKNISDIGLPANSTVTAVWSALPVSSIIICDATTVSNPPIADPGSLIVCKRTATDGFIQYKHKTDPDKNYTMYLNSNGVPTGTWNLDGDYIIDYETLLNGSSVGAGNVTIFANRKISDYTWLVAVWTVSNNIRATQIIPRPIWEANQSYISLFYVDSQNTQRWAEVTYVDDTHVRLAAGGSGVGGAMYLYGVVATPKP